MVSDEQAKQLLIQQYNKEIEMKGKLTFAQRLVQDSNRKQLQIQRQNTRKDRKTENGKDKDYSQFREQCIEIKNMLKMLENEEDKDSIHSPFLKVLTPTRKNLPCNTKQTKLIKKQLTPSCEQAKQNKWQGKWLTFNPQSYKTNNQKSLHKSDPIILHKSRELPIEFHSISKKGISNHGNTCYINSLLQCLFHLPHFNDYFASRQYQRQENGRKKQIVQMYRRLYCDINSTQKTDISTQPLKQSLSQACSLFIDWQQQDAHEFMKKLLNSIHEQLNRVDNKQLGKELKGQSLQKIAAAYWSSAKQRDDSYIYDNFEGQTYNNVRCINCNQESHTFDHFLDLSIPLTPHRKSLQELLQDYFRPEKLTDYYHCSSCNKSSKKSTKTVQLWRVPKFLIIHLKRSQLQCKNVEPITIPQSLTVKPFMGSSNDKTARLCQYSLCGVVMHEGMIQGGHYWANVRQRGNWYEMNDEKVKEINGEEIRRGLEDIGSRNAYILFYSSLYA